jgi:hypothetical protein
VPVTDRSFASTPIVSKTGFTPSVSLKTAGLALTQVKYSASSFANGRTGPPQLWKTPENLTPVN